MTRPKTKRQKGKRESFKYPKKIDKEKAIDHYVEDKGQGYRQEPQKEMIRLRKITWRALEAKLCT